MEGGLFGGDGQGHGALLQGGPDLIGPPLPSQQQPAASDPARRERTEEETEQRSTRDGAGKHLLSTMHTAITGSGPPCLRRRT